MNQIWEVELFILLTSLLEQFPGSDHHAAAQTEVQYSPMELGTHDSRLFFPFPLLTFPSRISSLRDLKNHCVRDCDVFYVARMHNTLLGLTISSLTLGSYLKSLVINISTLQPGLLTNQLAIDKCTAMDFSRFKIT